MSSVTLGKFLNSIKEKQQQNLFPGIYLRILCENQRKQRSLGPKQCLVQSKRPSVGE